MSQPKSGQEDGRTTNRMGVGGMTCAHCEVSVSRALESVGASEVSADFRRGEATFELPSGVDELALQRAVREAGYEPGRIEQIESIGGVEQQGGPAPGSARRVLTTTSP